MTRNETIEAYKLLSETQKENLLASGYYSATTGEHFGKIASCSLSMQGVEPGLYAPFSRVRKQKKYSRKGCKVVGFFHGLFFGEGDDKHFAGVHFGKLVNVKYLKNLDGTDAEIEDLKEEIKSMVWDK